jgi:hypothetical protein
MDWDEKKNLATKLKLLLRDFGCYEYESNKKTIILSMLKKHRNYFVATCLLNLVVWGVICYMAHQWFLIGCSLLSIYITTMWFSSEYREKILKKHEPSLQQDWVILISQPENQKKLIDLLYELKENLIQASYYNSIVDLIVEKNWNHLLRVLLHLYEDIDTYITNTENEELKEQARNEFLRKMYSEHEVEADPVLVRNFTIIKEDIV